MIRALGLAGCLMLAACATGQGPTRSVDDVAVQRLLALPVPDYFATLSLAADITGACPRYRFDAELESALNSLRNARGQGTLAALAQRNAITLETDVRQRSFIARHALPGMQGDLCLAADAELQEESPISALLVPV